MNLSNSGRLESLLHAGNLYLSAQDAVALAIENNLDIEVQRYGPLLAQEVLRRARAGGALRNVGLGVAAGPSSVSLTGVTVTNIGAVGTAGQGVSSGGGIVTQLGPPIASFDPTLSIFTNFAHITSPQSNTVLTGTTALIQETRSVQAQYQQNWDFGLSTQFTYYNQYTHVNSALFSIDPYTIRLSGPASNPESAVRIRIGGERTQHPRAEKQYQGDQSAIQAASGHYCILGSQLVLGLGGVLAGCRARASGKLPPPNSYLENNRKQVEAGTLAPIEVTRAEAQVYVSQQDLLVSQTNLLQQETVLKNAISRNGIANSSLVDAHVIPLDTITIPARDETPPVNQLVEQALANRSEIAQSRLNIDSNKLNLVGIKNALKPTLQAFAELTNNGLTGPITAVGDQTPGVGLSGRRLWQPAGRDVPPELSQLFRGYRAEHSAPEPRRAIRLRHQ